MNRLISTKYHFYPVPVHISMYSNIKLKKNNLNSLHRNQTTIDSPVSEEPL